MGWTYMPALKGHATPQAYLDAQLACEDHENRVSVLRSALAEDGVYYAAVEEVSAATGAHRVLAVICLVDYNPDRADGYIFGYKSLDESMGPYRYGCPPEILDLLTPTESPYALEWRRKCRERAAGERPGAVPAC